MSKNYLKPHLNLFYGFSQGGYNTIDDLSVLETNVTRAFIITLMNSEPNVLEEFLKKFIDKNSTFSNSKFTLESTFDGLPNDFQKDKEKKKRIILIITPRGEKPDLINPSFKKIIDIINENIQILSNQEKNRIVSECKGLRKKLIDKFKNKHKDDLKKILLKYMQNIQNVDLKIINFDQFRYILNLFRGSRPDAWIVTNEFLILIEVKIHGELNPVQINRHINENFRWAGSKKVLKQSRFLDKQDLPINNNPNYNSSNYIWKLVLSWRFNIYRFFKNILNIKNLDNKTNFLITEFKNFLEEIGMGKLAISSQDFDAVKNPNQYLEQLRSLREKMEEIALLTFRNYPNFKYTAIQKVKGDNNYVGLSIGENDKVKEEIHFSFGVNTRELRIYLTMQMKRLIERLINIRLADKNKFDKEFTAKLVNLKPIDEFHKAYLDIEDRWHFIRGKNYYFKDARIPIYPDDKVMNPAITMILNHLDNLTKNTRINLDTAQIKEWVDKYKTRSVNGVMSIGYHFREPFCNNLGEKIVDRAKIAIKKLMPVYEFLAKI